jgi:hypothetical protein
MAGGSKPSGGIDQFLMTLKSADALAKLSGVESMHEYRSQSGEAVQAGGETKAVRRFIIPMGFLQAHRLGDDTADQLLRQGCVVADTRWVAAQGWLSHTDVHWMPPAEVRQKIAERSRNTPKADTGEFDAPICATPLTLPKGLGIFENAVFISTDHPQLQGRSVGALPQLWLTIAPQADPTVTLNGVSDFLKNTAQPAQNAITLQVKSFADHSVQAVNGEQLGAWQARLSWITWLIGLALLTTLVLMRWGALRRELALRKALGQLPRVAWWKVAAPYFQAIMGGVLVGTLLAWPVVAVLLAAPLVQLAWQALQLLLVAMAAATLFGCGLAWSLREAPMLVLNRGAR